MGIEVATYVSDLQAANPGASDLRSQGDDHLRLIKAVLQASFPTSSKAFYNPTTAAKNANFTVVQADMNKTFTIDTSGGIVNMTLPTLAAGDAGWECFHIKTTTDVNPVLVKPAAGTLNSGAISGLAAARRAIPGARIRTFWTGSAWYVERAAGAGGPVGSAIDLHVATLPVGFEWPSGQTLASASSNYPEFYSINGSSGLTLDLRGRYSATIDNLGGSAAGRITTAGGAVDGATFGAVGGVQNFTLITANLPPYTPAGTNGSVTVTSNVGNIIVGILVGGVTSGAGSLTGTSGASQSTPTATGSGPTFTGTAQGGTSTPVKILPPTIMVGKILVVE